jgi:uncharacterized membrane protein YgaE (UPF0421/DUF939 family)
MSSHGTAKEQIMLVRRRAQPAAAYIVRLTGTAVFAYLLALLIPIGSARPVLAPLTALLIVQATLYQTIRIAAQKVTAVTAGVLAAVAVAAYVPFSWWVLGLLIAGTLALGMVLRLGDNILEVPISAMLIFSVDTHAAATARISDTLVGVAAGLAAGLLFAPLRVQPAKDAIGDLTRQMSSLLGQMAAGLAEVPEPRRAAEWLDRTRALRTEIEHLDDALGEAEESVRLNPRRLLLPNPAAGLREGVDTLERAATDMRVLARSVADSAKIDSEDSPVRDTETRTRMAAVIGELSAAVQAYGQFIEAGVDAPPAPGDHTPADHAPADHAPADHRPTGQATADHVPASQATADGVPAPRVPAPRTRAGRARAARTLARRKGSAPAAVTAPLPRLERHLAEAHRRQDDLADLLRTDPDENPDGWPLRGEILAHLDRLRTELEPRRRPPDRLDSTGPLRMPLGALRHTRKGRSRRRPRRPGS